MNLFRNLIPRIRREVVPSLNEAEVTAAFRRFKSLEPLCEAEAVASNDGFGASISFRTTSHQSSLGLGSIEIGLRTTALEFRAPQGSLGFSWSEALTDLVKEHRVSGSETRSTSRKTSVGTASTVDHEMGGSAGVSGVGITAGVKGNHRRGQKHEQVNEAQSSTSRTKPLTETFVDIEGLRDCFTLKLTAPGEHHLGYFNADLVRRSILSVPEPSTLALESVGIFLRSPMSEGQHGDLIHALSIRSASGAWAPLAATRNKQILGELVLSKFLQPLHRRCRLWPPRTRAAG